MSKTELKIELHQEKLDSINLMVKKSGLKDVTELFNCAMDLADFLINESSKGNELALINDRYKTIKRIENPLMTK